MYRLQCLLVLVLALLQVQVEVHYVCLFIYEVNVSVRILIPVLPEERNTFKVYCVFIVFTSSTVPCTCNRSE